MKLKFLLLLVTTANAICRQCVLDNQRFIFTRSFGSQPKSNYNLKNKMGQNPSQFGSEVGRMIAKKFHETYFQMLAAGVSPNVFSSLSGASGKFFAHQERKSTTERTTTSTTTTTTTPAPSIEPESLQAPMTAPGFPEMIGYSNVVPKSQTYSVYIPPSTTTSIPENIDYSESSPSLSNQIIPPPNYGQPQSIYTQYPVLPGLLPTSQYGVASQPGYGIPLRFSQLLAQLADQAAKVSTPETSTSTTTTTTTTPAPPPPTISLTTTTTAPLFQYQLQSQQYPSYTVFNKVEQTEPPQPEPTKIMPMQEVTYQASAPEPRVIQPLFVEKASFTVRIIEHLFQTIPNPQPNHAVQSIPFGQVENEQLTRVPYIRSQMVQQQPQVEPQRLPNYQQPVQQMVQLPPQVEDESLTRAQFNAHQQQLAQAQIRPQVEEESLTRAQFGAIRQPSFPAAPEINMMNSIPGFLPPPQNQNRAVNNYAGSWPSKPNPPTDYKKQKKRRSRKPKKSNLSA